MLDRQNMKYIYMFKCINELASEEYAEAKKKSGNANLER